MGFKDWYANQQARHEAYQAEQAAKKIDARVPTPTKTEVKRLRINTNLKREIKKLVKLQNEGWEITTEKHDKVYLSGQDTGWVTYMLTRTQ